MAEIFRLLTDIKVQMTGLENRIRDDRRHTEETFVRRDVYESDKRATSIRDVEAQKDLDELQRHREADVNWRRQVMLSIAVLALGSLVTVALAVSNYVTR
jgi:hypothetical protein